MSCRTFISVAFGWSILLLWLKALQFVVDSPQVPHANPLPAALRALRRLSPLLNQAESQRTPRSLAVGGSMRSRASIECNNTKKRA